MRIGKLINQLKIYSLRCKSFSFVSLLATYTLLRDYFLSSTDKDECQTREASCPQNSSCQNTAGSYRCECDRGLQLRNNKCDGKIYSLNVHCGSPFAREEREMLIFFERVCAVSSFPLSTTHSWVRKRRFCHLNALKCCGESGDEVSSKRFQ